MVARKCEGAMLMLVEAGQGVESKDAAQTIRSASCLPRHRELHGLPLSSLTEFRRLGVGCVCGVGFRVMNSFGVLGHGRNSVWLRMRY